MNPEPPPLTPGQAAALLREFHSLGQSLGQAFRSLARVAHQFGRSLGEALAKPEVKAVQLALEDAERASKGRRVVARVHIHSATTALELRGGSYAQVPIAELER